MREAESDLSFVDFGVLGRPPTAPQLQLAWQTLARREGLEPPTLRFEA